MAYADRPRKVGAEGLAACFLCALMTLFVNVCEILPQYNDKHLFNKLSRCLRQFPLSGQSRVLCRKRISTARPASAGDQALLPETRRRDRSDRVLFVTTHSYGDRVRLDVETLSGNQDLPTFVRRKKLTTSSEVFARYQVLISARNIQHCPIMLGSTGIQTPFWLMAALSMYSVIFETAWCA